MEKIRLSLLFSVTLSALGLALPVFSQVDVKSFQIYIGDHRDQETSRFADQAASKVMIELGASTVKALTNLGGGSEYYLYTRSGLVLFDIEKKERLGLWPLASAGFCPEGVSSCSPIWWAGRWNVDEVLESDTITRLQDMYGGLEFIHATKNQRNVDAKFVGCLKDNPFRYGDVDGDGEDEIIVFLERQYSLDWLIFSTKSKKTIFSTMLYVNDAINTANVPVDIVKNTSSKKYQYWMRSGVDLNYSQAMYSGLKSFAKLYVGNFDHDDNFDLLVWRKMYESRLVSDPLIGFGLESEMFAHFELVNGEYELQSTSEKVVEGWLEADALTWQKGFPNQSECKGEEGKLIPELHDELLNDLDVLFAPES